MPLSSAPALTAGELRVLDQEAAARAWNQILVRQGLASSRRLGSALEVADAVLGLHAARLPSPFAIVAARTSHPAIPASLLTSPVRATLMTVRCMRKTLHALPLPLAAAAHAATLRFRDRDARRAILNAGCAIAAIEELVGALCELLQDGPLPYRAIEAQLAARGVGIPAARLGIKLAWERGTIAYLNTAPAWNREARTFALTATAYPGLDLTVTRQQAITILITAYLDRYGPATIRDASWWSGLAAADITAALRDAGRPLIAIRTPWSSEPCLMFADQAPGTTGDDAARTGVQFLAHEDSALKAYFQTRDRYLNGLPQDRAFNQIGEARPCIIIDGVVAGTWAWNPRTASIDTSLITGRCPATARRQIRVRAAELTESLRAAWDHRSPSRPRASASLVVPENHPAARRAAATVTTPPSPAVLTR